MASAQIPQSPFIGANGRVSMEWLVWLQNLQSFSNPTGVLSIPDGGTGQSGLPTNGQLLIGNSGAFQLGSITGAINQINVVNNAGSITIGTTQDISPASSPMFFGLVVSDSISAGGGIGCQSLSASMDISSAANMSVGGFFSVAGAETVGGISHLTDVRIGNPSSIVIGYTLQVVGGGYVTGQWSANELISDSTLTIADTKLLKSTVSFSNGAASGAGTITNAPAAGNPTKWIPVNDNGTTRYIPAW